MSGARRFVAVLALGLLAGCSQIRAQMCEDAVAAAYFLSGGFEGAVIVTRDVMAGSLSFNATNLRKPSSSPRFNFVIHKLPMFSGSSASSCASMSPAVFNPTSAQAGMEPGRLPGLPLTDGTSAMTVASNLTMVGDNGIVGRSLGILTAVGNLVACANLEPVASAATGTMKPCSQPSDANHQETLMARFNGIVGGTAVLRHLATSTGPYLTTVYTHLYSTHGSNTSAGHAIKVYGGAPLETGECSGLKGAIVANLSASEASRVTISSVPSGYEGMSFSSMCLSMSLSQSTSSSSVSVAILAASANSPSAVGTLACAQLRQLPQRRVRATFSSGAATGWVTVSQASPFTPPILTQNFSSTTTNVNVHTLPVQQEGAIGSQLGALPQAQACSGTATLRGLYSLAGRSVSIGTGTQRQCQNLVEQLQSGDSVTRAKAEFTGSVRGTIYLTQVTYSDGALGETIVYSAGLTADSVSTGHNMHVHVGRIGWQGDVSACAGSFAGGHFDPYRVASNNATLYGQECGSRYPHRCEVGDTSRKTGQFDLNGVGFVRHDVNLPLSGTNSVIGRSFVIHIENGGAPRLACANIIASDAVTFQLRFPLSGLLGGPIDSVDFLRRLQALLVANSNAATVSDLQSFNTTSTGYIRGVLGGGAAVGSAARSLALSQDLGPYTDVPVPVPSSAVLAMPCIALLLATGLLSALL